MGNAWESSAEIKHKFALVFLTSADIMLLWLQRACVSDLPVKVKKEVISVGVDNAYANIILFRWRRGVDLRQTSTEPFNPGWQRLARDGRPSRCYQSCAGIHFFFNDEMLLLAHVEE